MRKVSWGRLRRPKSRRGTAVVVSAMTSALLVVVAIFAVTAQAGVNNAFTRVQRAAPAPLGGHELAAPSANATQSGFVALKPRDEAALKQFIANVTNRKSASFHHYLKAGQFASRFGPTQATIAAVKAQLVRDGLHVGAVSSDGLMIAFSGTTHRVESAFNTKLERYRTQAGVTGQLTTKTVELPADIASDVSAVLGLNTIVHPEAAVIHPPQSAYRGRAKAKTGRIVRDAHVVAPDPGAHTGANAACKNNAVQAAATTDGGLTDDQIANAYGAFGLYNAGDDGAGVHIALYELEPFAMSDLKVFDECYFGTKQAASMLKRVKTISVDGGQPSGYGSGESILDIDDVSGMAPGANIDVYEAPNTTAGGIDDYAQIIDNDQDQIISSSWGECEQDEELYDPGTQEAENYIFQQGAAQGQTVLSAAGDTGDDTCNEIRSVPSPTDQNPLSVMDPGSNPYVMSVGGTTLYDANPKNLHETVWNDGANWGGGGGGYSQTWAMPSWQDNASVLGMSNELPGAADWTNANTLEANAQKLGISDQAWPTGFCQSTIAGATSSTPCRALPDVSAQADEFTGSVTYYSATAETATHPSGWSTVGGTSSATPIWAAMLALTDESAACHAVAPSNGGGGIGLATPLLYAVAVDPAEYRTGFHDITIGNNDVYGYEQDKVFPAHAGYDLASGLGSPMLTSPSGGAGLAADVCGMVTAKTPAVTVTGVDPATGSVKGGGSVTVTGTGFEAHGASDVSSVQVGGAKVASADIAVDSSTSLTITRMPTGAAAAAPTSNGGSAGTQDGAGRANIVVTTSMDASSPLNSNSVYQYVDQDNSGDTVPMVSSVSPYAALNTDPGTLTIYGSGFGKGDTVTIGGQSATGVQYVSSNELKVTGPAYSASKTDCVTQAGLTAETNDTNPAADDICQTQVVVSNGTDLSRTANILPTYEGATVPTNLDGIPLVPSGYEETPQSTEFDYIPAPTITSVSTTKSNPGSLASESGTTVITITGTGLNVQTLNGLDIGNPNAEGTAASTYDYDSGTQLVLVAPAQQASVDSQSLSAYADTMADSGAPDNNGGAKVTSMTPGSVVYAGIPVVTGVSTGKTDKAIGLPVAPANASSATPVTVTGKGFLDAISGTGDSAGDLAMLEFNETKTKTSQSTSYGNTIASDTQIVGHTSNSNPDLDDVQVCTVSGCSAATSLSKKDPRADELLFYPPGNPKITRLSVSSGPAAGGQTVTIFGENLGCTTSIKFGHVRALAIKPTPTYVDCGATGMVTAVAPPGRLGSKVRITLTTVESDVTGAPAAVSPVKFRYTANPKLSARRLQFGSARANRNGPRRTLTVKNPAGAPVLSLGKITIKGADPKSFRITKDTCASARLRGGKSCRITVQFRPTTIGRRSATLRIPFDQATRPLTVRLFGYGKA